MGLNVNERVQSFQQITPMIYAYSTPEIARHNGWLKIGETKKGTDKRIGQQSHTIDVETKVEWKGLAVYDDGSGDTFHDTAFHAYLQKLGVTRMSKDNEWFQVGVQESRGYFYDFRANRGIIGDDTAVSYDLRSEQADAVDKTLSYARSHDKAEYLWNCKPRFGKTLSSYDFCKHFGAEKILIVTNRPAIANSWYADYVMFFGTKQYLFVSDTSALKGEKYVVSSEEFLKHTEISGEKPFIEFLSLQDLKGSLYFGGQYDKLEHIANTEWDVLIIDEAHEGVDTYKTDVAFDRIKRKFTLHLSGTPFKAIANEKFTENAIYNWTYADEQAAKENWDNTELSNPYDDLPKLNLFTYQMSEIVAAELEQGVEIDGETVEYAFDLNEFFKVENGKFKYDSAVDKFLDALTKQVKFPFSTQELRDKLKHTFWLLNRVESAKVLAKKLNAHPVFKEYEVVLAAGDGRIDDVKETEKAYTRVRKAIAEHDKTITLSVGQLTTGVTIPEWTAVLMLSNVKSPALYMQAAFRAQNPCKFYDGTNYYRKENAYIFDFDPARTLTIFEEFANDLSSQTADGRGDTDTRKNNIRELLNFFPVIGEDENGEMIELDAEKVLSIPRKIHALEVVRRGFMSDFLFQNISNIFHAPPEVVEMIYQFEPTKEADAKVTSSTSDDLSLNSDGEVEIPKEKAIGIAQDLFGDKIFSEVIDTLHREVDAIQTAESTQSEEDAAIEAIKKKFQDTIKKPMIDEVKKQYGSQLDKTSQKRLERRIDDNCDRTFDRHVGRYKTEKKIIENQHKKDVEACTDEDTRRQIDEDYSIKMAANVQKFQQEISSSIETLVHQTGQDVVVITETAKKEGEKKTLEDGIRDHMRGFSRTIPSFLMAYGDDNTTLENFDIIIPDEVFREVTSISIADFCFLRDGGDYTDRETGETKHFDGHLFNPVVFNDSVKEFMRLRKELADYFDEKQQNDIFDYIPPQKTNQIFTPRSVVKKMVDALEENNPGCFDDPDKTFADLYMKSGLYITEIIKRLYRSEKMKIIFPDDKARLEHIITNQVYGIAPTEIIYRIAMNYILGFENSSSRMDNPHFACADTAELAKNGLLEDSINSIIDE